jgi:hypothetical protein
MPTRLPSLLTFSLYGINIVLCHAHVLHSIPHSTHISALFLYTRIAETFHNHYTSSQSHQSKITFASGFTTCDPPLGVCIARFGGHSLYFSCKNNKIVSPWQLGCRNYKPKIIFHL